MTTRPTRVVIAIENISIDRDPRARLFARSLANAGFEVSVVCPRSHDPSAPEMRRNAERTTSDTAKVLAKTAHD